MQLMSELQGILSEGRDDVALTFKTWRKPTFEN